MIQPPQQDRISLSDAVKTMTDREYAEYIIATMGGSFGECDRCQKDALEAILSRPYTPASSPASCSECELKDGCREESRNSSFCIKQAAQAARLEQLKELQKFIDDADSREGCEFGMLSIAMLVRWMSARGYDCD